MNTQEYILKYQVGKIIPPIKYKVVDKNYIVAGEPMIKCNDAILLNYKYAGIRLSDIFIFDPNYITYLINNKYTPEQLRKIALDISKIQRSGMEDISRKISLGAS